MAYSKTPLMLDLLSLFPGLIKGSTVLHTAHIGQLESDSPLSPDTIGPKVDTETRKEGGGERRGRGERRRGKEPGKAL